MGRRDTGRSGPCRLGAAKSAGSEHETEVNCCEMLLRARFWKPIESRMTLKLLDRLRYTARYNLAASSDSWWVEHDAVDLRLSHLLQQ